MVDELPSNAIVARRVAEAERAAEVAADDRSAPQFAVCVEAEVGSSVGVAAAKELWMEQLRYVQVDTARGACHDVARVVCQREAHADVP